MFAMTQPPSEEALAAALYIHKPPATPSTTGGRTMQHVKVYAKVGRFGGWPANHGIWSWGNEILVGFGAGYYKNLGPTRHHIDRQASEEHLLARSLDGGLTVRNITGDVLEGERPIRTDNDYYTKSSSLISWLETRDGVTWTIGGRQTWGDGERPQIVDWSNSQFSLIPEPSTLFLSLVALGVAE